MSRIGKKPVEIPSGVSVRVNGGEVTVEKSGNTLTMTARPEVTVTVDEGAKQVTVAPAPGHEESRDARAYWGLTRALVQNMIIGVDKGYEKKLEIVGVGWGAEVKGGKSLDLKVGYANVVSVPIPMGIDVNVERQMVTVKGTDKQAVGQFAAAVRSKRKPEPYNGKGIKYHDEVVRRKQGKVFGS